MTPLTRILRTATRKTGDPLNIATICTHERVESLIARTGHNFYAFTGNGLKDWNSRYAPQPPNYTLLNGFDVPPDIAFDIALSQTRFNHWDIANGLKVALNIPHINLCHMLPNPTWSAGMLKQMQGRAGDLNVYITEQSRDEWAQLNMVQDNTVIEHGVDTDFFKPAGYCRRQEALSVVNKWEQRDSECGYTFWKEATNGLPVVVLGDNPGLSEEASSTGELLYSYQMSLVFVNTSLISPIPYSLLEAMACGCAVVTTRNPTIESVVVNGRNGWLCDTPGEMHDKIAFMLDHPATACSMGKMARETIVERFGLNRFLAEWNVVFERAANLILTGEVV